MIKRIELTNFMSHVHTVIEPAAGLTVLVGPNNCGKSAVVAALQVLCHNENSLYVLRHGCTECSVKVETTDGHTVEWRRKKGGSPQYWIDGQQFDRLGRSLPDTVKTALERALQLPLVESDREEFDIHFGAQKAPIFLLDATGSQRAQFFALSSDAIRLVEMQALHRKRAADAQRDKTRLEAESKQLADELEHLHPVVELDQQLIRLEREYAALGALTVRIDAAQRVAAAWLAQQASLRRRQLQIEALQSLVPPPPIPPTDSLAELIGELATVFRQRQVAADRAAALAALPQPPPQADLGSLARAIDELNTTQQIVTIWQAESGALNRLQPPPPQLDTSELAALLARLDGAHLRLATNRRRSQMFGKLPSPPVASETAGLADGIAQLQTSAARLATCRQQATDAQAALAEAAQDLKGWVAANPQCPTCGAAVDAADLVERAAAGLGGHPHV